MREREERKGKCFSYMTGFSDLGFSDNEITNLEFPNIDLFHFVFFIFENYVKAYCDGKVKDVIPFSIIDLKKISGQTFNIQKELLEGFSTLSKSDKNTVLDMFVGK